MYTDPAFLLEEGTAIAGFESLTKGIGKFIMGVSKGRKDIVANLSDSSGNAYMGAECQNRMREKSRTELTMTNTADTY